MPKSKLSQKSPPRRPAPRAALTEDGDPFGLPPVSPTPTPAAPAQPRGGDRP